MGDGKGAGLFPGLGYVCTLGRGVVTELPGDPCGVVQREIVEAKLLAHDNLEARLAKSRDRRRDCWLDLDVDEGVVSTCTIGNNQANSIGTGLGPGVAHRRSERPVAVVKIPRGTGRRVRRLAVQRNCLADLDNPGEWADHRFRRGHRFDDGNDRLRGVRTRFVAGGEGHGELPWRIE